MDFIIPGDFEESISQFEAFLSAHLKPHIKVIFYHRFLQKPGLLQLKNPSLSYLIISIQKDYTTLQN